MSLRKRSSLLQVRLLPEVKSLAEELARRENRSLSNWIEAVILEKSKEEGLLKNDKEES